MSNKSASHETKKPLRASAAKARKASVSQLRSETKASIEEGKNPTSAEKNEPEILVTGAGGTLAQLVISQLRAKHKIVAVDFRHKPQIGSDISSYKLDLNKRAFEDVFRNHNIKKVIHLGRIGAQQSTREARYNANVIGTQKLLDYCAKYKVEQVIVMSTYYVYGANAYNPALIEEDAPLKAAEITMDLVDSVELENLANIYLWKHPEINVTVLRPCNIVGPGINNTMSQLLSSKRAPFLIGFSPLMQFIHVEDMAEAIVRTMEVGASGIYNVAPDDWVSYHKVLELSACKRFPIPAVPLSNARRMSRLLSWKIFPYHLVNYFKYPVIIDSKRFKDTFDFEPKYQMEEIFTYYREMKV